MAGTSLAELHGQPIRSLIALLAACVGASLVYMTKWAESTRSRETKKMELSLPALPYNIPIPRNSGRPYALIKHAISLSFNFFFVMHRYCLALLPTTCLSFSWALLM